jgi:pSer/pThr/pTyr-binding forkhead associated (FHA) protein
MTSLRIRWAGGEATYVPGDTVRIGRDPQSDVLCDNTNVSRQHAEVTYSGAVWKLRDVGSAQGTWRDGRRVDAVDVRGTVQVTLGKEGRGEVLTLDAAAADVAGFVQPTEIPGLAGVEPTRIVGAAGAGGSADGTVIVGAGAAAHRPGGPLRADAVVGDTVVTGDVLNVECAGRSYSFSPGRDITIGRGDDCDVVSSNPTVSRLHSRLVHDGSGWMLRDAGSSGGTFVDGRRVSEQRVSGSVAVWLGDPATGERLVLVASGPNAVKSSGSRPWWRAVPVLIGAAIIGAVVLGFLVMQLVGGGNGTPMNVDQLGRATVRLVSGDRVGSGTIIDAERGLILTNAHVVAPDAPGSAVRDTAFDFELDSTPRQVQVDIAPALGKAAEPRYIAEIVVVDGYADLAVLRITKTIGGQIIEPGSGDLEGLESVSIGDSSTVSVGDRIRVFGYPTAAQTSSVTLTEGSVSSLVQDERMRSSRAMLNISAAISPGNSGGLAVDESGDLIGVPSLIRDDTVPSMRPSQYAVALIEAARTGEPYVSPWYRTLTTEEITDIGIVDPGRGVGAEFECATGQLQSVDRGGVGVAFDFEGFGVDEHQDLLVVVYSGDTEIGVWTSDSEYPLRWKAESGCVTITVPVDSDAPIDPATLNVLIGLGPTYDTTP